MSGKNVRSVIDAAATQLGGSVTARRDAELLLMRAAGRDRAWLMTHPEAELTPAQIAELESWIARRARREPIQHILGETEFYGLTFTVTPHVLIPRPETEHLVEAALEKIPPHAAVRVCDVGTGSGCIAVALAMERPRAEVKALDLSPSALQVARENAERHGMTERVRLVESALLDGVRGERFDVVVSNPPYVPEDEVLEPQVQDWEPHDALFAGADGLEVYRRLIPQAWEALIPGGWLLMEIGHGQREALARLLENWHDVRFKDDLQGIPRVAIARRRA
jgi:release factor glutamine methyltransferase